MNVKIEAKIIYSVCMRDVVGESVYTSYDDYDDYALGLHDGQIEALHNLHLISEEEYQAYCDLRGINA